MNRLLLFPFVLKFRSQKVIIESFTNEKREESIRQEKINNLQLLKRWDQFKDSEETKLDT